MFTTPMAVAVGRSRRPPLYPDFLTVHLLDLWSGGSRRLLAGSVGKLHLCPCGLIKSPTKGLGPGEADMLQQLLPV